MKFQKIHEHLRLRELAIEKNYTIENCIIAIVITLIIVININHNSVVNNVACFGPFLSSCHMPSFD